MIDKDTPYEIKKYNTSDETNKDYYVLYYKGKILPNQTKVVLEENGKEKVSTVTVTFELLKDNQ